MGGNDTLDGGGRIGGYLDGGHGDDILLQSTGPCVGGAGADLFFAAGRGAMTVPYLAVAALDFDAADGDRIHIIHATQLESGELFESAQLSFDPETHQLILSFGRAPKLESVDQIIFLPELEQFDPSWVTVGPAW